MAEVTPVQQFFGTALAILIMALFLYGIILLIQWLTKRNGTSRIIEHDTIVEETVVQPVQTQVFTPRVSTVGAMPSMGAGGSAAGAAARVGGGGSKGGAL